jgi:carbon storage regulator CsrA
VALSLTRKLGERIVIGKDIVITVTEIYGKKGVKLEISAPKEVKIDRFEVAMDRGVNGFEVVRKNQEDGRSSN